MSKTRVQRNYKDTVFRLIFKDKKELLSLYNATNGTNYDNVDDLEINTLENAVYMNMKNDISFVFDFELNLFEQQSSVNPNMPLRDLFYVSRVLQNIVKNENLYGGRQIKIPAPKFVVFYNGNKEMAERSVIRLSDMFEKSMQVPELELIVTVLNINPGKNEQLMKNCQLLNEYMIYTTKVRENLTKMDIEEAVNKAVQECMEEGILSEFLKKNRAEAIAVSIFEYNEEEHMKSIREEGEEEGIKKGIEKGIEKGMDIKGARIFLNLLERGFSRKEAQEIADISDELVENVLSENHS